MDGRLEYDEIYNMDCLQGLELVRPSSVDLVVTDPPFAIDFKPRRPNYNRRGSRGP